MEQQNRTVIEERLDALFRRIFRMSDAELRLLRMHWEDQVDVDRAAAWSRARAVMKHRQREDLMEDVRSTITAWGNSYLGATVVEYGAFLTNPGSGMVPSEVRRGAIPPILDAAVAIIAADGLGVDERQVLYEPISRLQPRPLVE